MIIPLCVKCGGERYISSDKNPICKTCRGVKKKIKRKPKEYNQEKINKVKEQNRIWRESNKEIIKIKKREDYLKNKDATQKVKNGIEQSNIPYIAFGHLCLPDVIIQRINRTSIMEKEG